MLSSASADFLEVAFENFTPNHFLLPEGLKEEESEGERLFLVGSCKKITSGAGSPREISIFPAGLESLFLYFVQSIVVGSVSPKPQSY